MLPADLVLPCKHEDLLVDLNTTAGHFGGSTECYPDIIRTTDTVYATGREHHRSLLAIWS